MVISLALMSRSRSLKFQCFAPMNNIFAQDLRHMVLLRGFNLQETAPIAVKPPASTSPGMGGPGYTFNPNLQQSLLNQGQFINQQQVRVKEG